MKDEIEQNDGLKPIKDGIMDTLQVLDPQCVSSLLRECGMDEHLNRIDRFTGREFEATEAELLHMQELANEALESQLNNEALESQLEAGIIAFDKRGHLVQMNGNRVTVYF